MLVIARPEASEVAVERGGHGKSERSA
jgi:hypothetical protein